MRHFVVMSSQSKEDFSTRGYTDHQVYQNYFANETDTDVVSTWSVNHEFARGDVAWKWVRSVKTREPNAPFTFQVVTIDF